MALGATADRAKRRAIAGGARGAGANGTGADDGFGSSTAATAVAGAGVGSESTHLAAHFAAFASQLPKHPQKFLFPMHFVWHTPFVAAQMAIHMGSRLSDEGEDGEDEGTVGVGMVLLGAVEAPAGTTSTAAALAASSFFSPCTSAGSCAERTQLAAHFAALASQLPKQPQKSLFPMQAVWQTPFVAAQMARHKGSRPNADDGGEEGEEEEAEEGMDAFSSAGASSRRAWARSRIAWSGLVPCERASAPAATTATSSTAASSAITEEEEERRMAFLEGATE